jgi:hypothetical protein
MSTDELRRMLNYPDDGFVVDTAAVRERAHRHQARRRRLSAVAVIGAACAVAVTATVTLGPLTGSGTSTVRVSPSDESATSAPSPDITSPSPQVSSPATPTTSPATLTTSPATPTMNAATVTKATGGTRVPMGQGWLVWVRPNGDVCRSAPPDKVGHARFQPFGCRSTSDGNIGGLSVQSSGSRLGTMYSAVIPYPRARVDVVIDGERLAADTVRFDRVANWTFYYLWVPGRADLRTTHVGVIAYDRNDMVLDQFGVR